MVARWHDSFGVNATFLQMLHPFILLSDCIGSTIGSPRCSTSEHIVDTIKTIVVNVGSRSGGSEFEMKACLDD
jgi:hypothetical protein